MLWQLATNNIRRNWMQNLLGIIGVAVAAAVMTASISLGAGYPERAWVEHRTFIGADIIIYPGQLGVAYEDVGSRDTGWQWSLREDRQLNDLFFFHPRIYREGYIHPPGQMTHFDTALLPDPLAADRHHAEIVTVEPLLKIPARVMISDEGHVGTYPAPLRARNVELDHEVWDVEPYVSRGRWFEPEEEGEFVVLMQANRGINPPEQGTRPQYRPPSVDDRLVFEVPHLRGYVDGYPVWDWENTLELEMTVVGLFSFPTDMVPLVDERGAFVTDSEGRTILIQNYIDTEDVFIPEETWHRIWDRVAPAGVAPAAYQLNVTLGNMYRAREVASQLQGELPGTTVLTVPEQATISRRDRGQTAVPADVSVMLVVAMFMVAGLLLVANMYVLIMQRRKEMAVLKAVGMASGHVLGLIMIETILISVIGATLGFLAVRTVVTGVLLISEVTMAEIGMLTLRAGATVVGVSVLIASIFGLLPAYLAMKQTTMEVLRDA